MGLDGCPLVGWNVRSLREGLRSWFGCYDMRGQIVSSLLSPNFAWLSSPYFAPLPFPHFAPLLSPPLHNSHLIIPTLWLVASFVAVQATACGVSGLNGDNLQNLIKSIEQNCGVRKGKGNKKSFRATISSVSLTGRRVNMQCKVVRGNLTVGETVSVAPAGVCGTVKEVS